MHREAQGRSRNRDTPSKYKTLCPKCSSSSTIKRGTRHTIERGHQQTYYCKDCAFRFTPDTGFWRMKKNQDRISQAIDTYYEGLSLRKVKRNFYKYANTEVSHQSVLNWLRKYAYLMREYVSTLKPALSGHYLTDEVIISCGGEQHNFGVVMDNHSRYVISTRYTERAHITADDNIQLWSAARDVQRPRRFTSDNHKTYKIAFNKVFYTRYAQDRVHWQVINHLRTGKHNYRMERLWNNLRERIKIMRGFKKAWSAKLLLDGYFIWHNFIRPHMGLQGKTPSEVLELRNTRIQELIFLNCSRLS